MLKLYNDFVPIDIRITNWMARHSITLLRLGLGLVFFWFGVIKFVPGLSPADALATRTINVLTFGIIPPAIALPLLALWETFIGLGLLTGRFLRVTLLLLFLQLLGTVTPLILFPQETWRLFPISATLEGQYIIKNIVLAFAGLVIGATVRGGAVIADPEAAQEAIAKQQAKEKAIAF